MKYAHIKPEKLLNLTFEKRDTDKFLEYHTLIDYLVNVNNMDRYFKSIAKIFGAFNVEFLIKKDNRSIIKEYTRDGDVWIKKPY